MSECVNEITNECVIDATNAECEANADDTPQTIEPETKSIERKPVKNLTEAEKQILINDARAGRDSSNYNVKFFKNGNVHITQKKLTKSQHLIAAQGEPTNDIRDRPILTNEQLLMEHVMDLENKFTKMSMKHKKLKKRYAELESNIYYEDNGNAEPDNADTDGCIKDISEPVSEDSVQPAGHCAARVSESVAPMPTAQGVRKGWRSRFI